MTTAANKCNPVPPRSLRAAMETPIKVKTKMAAAVGLPAWFPINEYALRFIAAWLPNVLFAALGLWLYVKAPK